MAEVDSSAFVGMQQLASVSWPVGWHPGGLDWALARGELADELVVARDGAAVVGWVGRSGDGDVELLAHVEPGRRDVAQSLVRWLMAGRAKGRSIEVFDGDTTLTPALRAAGFEPAERTVGVFRDINAPSPQMPKVYVIRPGGQDEVEARVQAHRAAWRPASLPYVDGRTFDPALHSGFDAAAYDRVRNAWLYDGELDLVVEAPDGSLAGSCIVWLDPASGVAEIQPLGVVPEHRRCGLAVAVCLEAVARVRNRDGQQVFINTGPVTSTRHP